MRCFLAIALIVAAAWARAEQQAAPDPAAIKKISVVKTWKELRAQPEIHIGGGVTVRLGIETLRSPRLSGVMVYGLAENYEMDWESPDPDLQLGPVQIRVAERGVEKAEAKIAVQKRELEGITARRMMFAQVAAVNGKGIYDITVLDQNGKTLAACAIEATDEATPAWSPLQENGVAAAELQEEGSTPEVHLSYDGTVSAVPKLEGWMPMRWEGMSGEREPVAFGDDDPLPNLRFDDAPKIPEPSAELIAKVRALLPKLGDDDFDTREKAMRELEALGKPARSVIANAAKESSDTEVRARAQKLAEFSESEFAVRMSGKNFLLSMSSGMDSAMFQESMLARWWVNGKPFVPGPVERAHEGRGLLAESAASRHVLLNLELNAAKLGAKSGDKIGVQFLYCPLGYEIVDEQLLKVLRAMTEMKASRFPRISNKIEFTAP